METSQTVIVFRRETLRDFKAECLLRDTSPTKEINRLVEEQLAAWKWREQEERQEQGGRR